MVDRGKDKDSKAPAGMAVSITTPRSEQFARTVVATGSVYAWQEAVIGSEVGGYRVAQVRVDVGDKVRKGQELVRLADEMVAAEVASKKAAKAQADALNAYDRAIMTARSRSFRTRTAVA